MSATAPTTDETDFNKEIITADSTTSVATIGRSLDETNGNHPLAATGDHSRPPQIKTEPQQTNNKMQLMDNGKISSTTPTDTNSNKEWVKFEDESAQKPLPLLNAPSPTTLNKSAKSPRSSLKQVDTYYVMNEFKCFHSVFLLD